jgi:two-component system NtrC family sensor kinase
MSDVNPYKIAYEREVKARKLAEQLLENKTRELYDNVVRIGGVVDELNATQAQLIQSEKMSSLGQLTAGIAHEINNPIGFSYSNISCLEDYFTDYLLLDKYIIDSDLFKENKEIFFKDYRQIREKINADHLNEDIPILIKDTLEGITRVKNIVANLKKISYKGNDEFTSCSINECINDCIQAVKSQFKYSMEITRALNPCPNILGQASDLNQVFINLLINAYHACEENGQLSIQSFHDKSNVIVIIKDNGKGISPKNLQKIFDPFYTTKDIGEGTGLGLSISHGIIEKHRGKIDVKSTVNQGTSFTISLPIE